MALMINERGKARARSPHVLRMASSHRITILGRAWCRDVRSERFSLARPGGVGVGGDPSERRAEWLKRCEDDQGFQESLAEAGQPRLWKLDVFAKRRCSGSKASTPSPVCRFISSSSSSSSTA
eukprot:scaffold167229_cov27-Tisochrysis_lutea.AAC.2